MDIETRVVRILFGAVVLCLGTSAWASLDQRAISSAGFNFLPNAQLPLEAPVNEAASRTTLGTVLGGKPALLLFVDYRCRSFCGVMLDELGDVLPKVNLSLRNAYNIVTVALDETQTRQDVDAFRDQHTIGTILNAEARFLTEDRNAREAIERSVGLVAPFDAEHRQFAHPAALIVVDAKGRAQQMLSPFALNPFDVTLALSGASPSASTLRTKILHLCYGWDPVVGLYTLRLERILAALAAATIVALLGLICLLLRAERKSRPAET